MTIEELEAFFTSADLPDGPIDLNPSAKINNVRHFLESHFGPLKADPSNPINRPLKDRLEELMEVLRKQQP